MKKKIFLSVFVSAAAVLLACLILTMTLLFRYLESVQKRQLSAECLLAAQGVETEGVDYFDGFSAEDFRVTLVGVDGTVLFDSAKDASAMENHLNREEIEEAVKSGVGESERYSDTLLEKNIYYARRLSNGGVIRVSVTYSSVWALLLGMLPPVIFILLGALVLSLVLAEYISKRIVRPLNSLDLEKPLQNDTYEELSPLLNRIEHLRRDISERAKELQRKRDEFSAVTDGMAEGLVLLGETGEIISINRAAAELFGTDKSAVGNSFLTVCRSTAVGDIIEAGGGETVLEIAGRKYQISASRVASDSGSGGICLLTYDVTEKLQSEQMRREFTANVSHELKTPLHTIMGTAELLKNKMVAEKDIPHFTGMIMSEAERLVRLVNDIIRLSQLEGAVSLPTETVDLYELAAETVEALHSEAKAKSVEVGLVGEKAEFVGVRPLLYEIIYNLCDNAIRYNNAGGRVEVSVTKKENGTELKVTDSGIGIPEEHRARIFERFYRVDKSRSRACGGTGLGLSIVKHAAEYHGAKITLNSGEGEGTEITVLFPRG